jgi:hypothetical protein
MGYRGHGGVILSTRSKQFHVVIEELHGKGSGFDAINLFFNDAVSVETLYCQTIGL